MQFTIPKCNKTCVQKFVRLEKHSCYNTRSHHHVSVCPLCTSRHWPAIQYCWCGRPTGRHTHTSALPITQGPIQYCRCGRPITQGPIQYCWCGRPITPGPVQYCWCGRPITPGPVPVSYTHLTLPTILRV